MIDIGVSAIQQPKMKDMKPADPCKQFIMFFASPVVFLLASPFYTPRLANYFYHRLSI